MPHMCVVMLLDSRVGKNQLRNDQEVQCRVLLQQSLSVEYSYIQPR